MANQTETGHAKNVANFGILITSVNGFGEAYNPSKQTITTTALASLYDNAKDVMRDYNGLSGAYGLAVANREVAFEPLSKLATRILNALRASDVTKQVIEAAESLVRKIQGKRATPKKTEEQKAALLAEGKGAKEVSSSQMSFDNRLDSFDKLIQLLGNISQYAPNEEELKVSTLSNFYAALSSANSAAGLAETDLSNIRLTRNELLYKAGTGLVDVAMSVKTYVKSLFGATSPQFKQVSGLVFKSEKL
jgi:hypothetical protein